MSSQRGSTLCHANESKRDQGHVYMHIPIHVYVSIIVSITEARLYVMHVKATGTKIDVYYKEHILSLSIECVLLQCDAYESNRN